MSIYFFNIERDETDRRMIEIALNRSIPIYGFCRGMQSILAYFDCELENIEDHVAVRHQVQGTWGIMEVNSYHNQGCKQIRFIHDIIFSSFCTTLGTGTGI